MDLQFLKYQHIERLGTSEVEGIELGKCYIFPKIDGTNSQVWINKGEIKGGSRNRVLSLENDNAGFYNWVITQENIKKCLIENPNLRLYGEWLVPHTLRTYREDAWKNFYIFDIYDHSKSGFLSYEIYKPICEQYNLNYIPPICTIINPTYEQLINQLEKNVYLIKDGQGSGEGIVIKNYSYFNKYGRQTWAKIVKNEFKAKHSKAQTTELKGKKKVEEEIVNQYVTSSFVKKEYAKLTIDNGWSSKLIPRLLQTIYYELVKEEAWNFVKKYKNPTINFKTLQQLTILKIKELMPQLF